MLCPKCNHQRSADDDPTVPHYQCPKCGIVYAKFGKPTQIKPGLIRPVKIQKQKIELVEQKPLDIQSAQLLLDRHKTNHILHLLLSVLSIGFWLPIWLIISASNANERNKINIQSNLPIESNTAGQALIILALIIVFIAIQTVIFH